MILGGNSLADWMSFCERDWGNADWVKDPTDTSKPCNPTNHVLRTPQLRYSCCYSTWIILLPSGHNWELDAINHSWQGCTKRGNDLIMGAQLVDDGPGSRRQFWLGLSGLGCEFAFPSKSQKLLMLRAGSAPLCKARPLSTWSVGSHSNCIHSLPENSEAVWTPRRCELLLAIPYLRDICN